MERFLIPNDSYIDIQRQDEGNETCITIKITPVPEYKYGDFVVTDNGSIIIYKDRTSYHAFLTSGKILHLSSVCYGYEPKRHASDAERKEIIDVLAKKGKRWNDIKKCIEDIPVYKEGDILVKEFGYGEKYIFVLDRIAEDDAIYHKCYYRPTYGETSVNKDSGIGTVSDSRCKCLRYADVCEKELIIYALSKFGKRLNEKGDCVDIQQAKFKGGDKVRIKDGISSETHMYESPSFIPFMDELIGKELTVKGSSPSGHIQVLEATCIFAEDWLEPWSEEPKKGDLCIFWDLSLDYPHIQFYKTKLEDVRAWHIDSNGTGWSNAIKFDGTREQYDKIREGEL